MGTKESHYSNIKLSETGDHCSASYEYKTNKYVKLACSEQRRHHRNTQYAGVRIILPVYIIMNQHIL
jgi:hypothetical protein